MSSVSKKKNKSSFNRKGLFTKKLLRLIAEGVLEYVMQQLFIFYFGELRIQHIRKFIKLFFPAAYF